MIVWGPPFPGEELLEIINAPCREEEALDALRFWLGARIVLEIHSAEKKSNSGIELPPYGPAGALIVTGTSADIPYPKGTVFFPPPRLLKRTMDANGAEALLDAERYFHPDLKGADGISFSAGVMLYSIFCGASPFSGDTDDCLRQNIREGVFIPPNLASPGLAPEMSALIVQAISPATQSSEAMKPRPDIIIDLLGPPASKQVSSWVKPLSEEEISKIASERDQYCKKKTLAVKRRRFMSRNAAIICISLAAVIALTLFTRGIIHSRAELPATKGMDPVEVVETYYSAFDNLDHALMTACVTGKAGRGDIEMAVNLFVIGRVRQAYESQNLVFPAREWIEAGCPVTEKIVFGITDLFIKALPEDKEKANFEADYIIWIPGTREAPDEEENASRLPLGLVSKDTLSLVFQKGVWRIAEIKRESRPQGF